MSPLEARNSATVGPKKCNIAEAQDKNFKIAIMNMLVVFKEEMNKFIKSIKMQTVE